MDTSIRRKRTSLALAGLAALTVGAGAMQANVITATSPVTVSCSTATGPGTAASITVKPVSSTALTTSTAITVTFVTPSGGLVVTAPSTNVISATNQSAGITFTVNTSPGCVGNTTGATVIQFKAAVGTGSSANDATVTANDTVTVATSSAISANPVTITCALTTGPVYTPGPSQVISITSAASGGTPFTVATGYASWLTLGTPSGSTASASPVTMSAVAASGCGGFSAGSTNTTTVHLVSTGGGPDRLVVVTLLVVPPSPLTVSPVPAAANISLSYIKSSGATATANVSVTSTVAHAFFSVNTATLPIWLTVNTISGTATAPLSFSTTSVADTLAPGTYSATVYFKVSGYADLGVPVTLLVTNRPPSLSVSSTSIPINWTLGTAPPTTNITVTSTDSPIPYTITTGGLLGPIVSASNLSGLAYSFGNQIPVSFNPLAFATAQPGSVLTGTVTFSWGSPVSTTVVTIAVTVASPGATLSGLSPASLPTASVGSTFPVVLTGSGFVGGSNASLKTKVGIVVGGVIVADTNLSANVVNPSNIILTITVPGASDANLPFSPTGTGGNVVIGLCNGICTIPTGTANLTIGNGPIIQGITSSSAFIEVAPPALTTVAPYDMVSVFGTNFCSSGGTGCSTSQLLLGSPDPLTLRFPTTLSPDAAGATQRVLSVSFLQHGTSTLIANAPMLFANNSQMNVIVPAAVSGFIGSSTVDVVVNFGYGTGATLLKSSPFPLNVAASDPGIFTVGSDGQGPAAALSTAYTLVTTASPAGVRTGAHAGPDSDFIQVYVTGLGAPTSTGSDLATGSGCIADISGTGNYESVLQSATSVSPALTSIDGAVIQSALLLSGDLPPCLSTLPTVTIGGVASTVTYAGFVPDTVAGLYQLNVQLPASTGATFYPNFPLTSSPISAVTAPIQLPIQITVGSQTSQTNVMVAVAPRLLVTGPTGNALNATVGVPWTGTVAAFEGTGSILYSLSSGLLPAGVTLAPTTGVISGTPNANTAGSYSVVITATDSANVPVTGTYSMTIVVAGGLFMTLSGTSPYNATFGTASNSLTHVTATGGTYGATGYTYAITTPSTVPTGMAITSPGTSGTVSTSALTPAGVYNGIVVTATDSSSTPLTGTATFQITVALRMTTTIAPVTQAASSGNVLTQVTATGNTGTLAYTLDAASVTAGLAIDSSGNVTTGTAIAGTYSIMITATDDTTAPGATAVATGVTAPITVTVN